ncbi:hypothetical protein [Neobacillus sp. PS3-40]|uniref:YqgU-like beta propeller domain-containing protein n=1 Tax=Neobacillus sp. PS3-40 TaxID=3070679 RepID=UPI0027E10055|nr:hypothetical protein [Neobacillus sp. PS3-40]WML45303.1 hypothetical protein RCG20_05190 [Neobacillus sp. PS3-40]
MKLVVGQKWNRQYFALQVFIIFILIFLLNACSLSDSSKVHTTKRNADVQKHMPSHNFTGQNSRLPISIPEGEFFKVVGWLSNDQIIYITNQEQTSNLYSYSLSSGHSKLLYKSEHPIVTAVISPAKKNILIQSSPSTYQAIVTVINTKGKLIWNQTLASFELEFEWNPYNESKILISKFNEDWTFKVFQLDVEQKRLTDLSLPQPFVKWVGKNSVAYINWNQTNQALFAPLTINKLVNSKESIAFPKVYQFSTTKNFIMTITVSEQEKTNAIYTFFDHKYHSVFSFSLPQLTKFSDWLVPFYDFNERKQQFLTFRPLRSTEADTYSDGFQLVSYPFKSRKSNVLLEGLKNEPLSCSPSGDACLYGGRFEKLIDIKAKKILKLVKE